MRILVTGGAGFVGSHLVDRLVRDGHEVAVVDDLSNGSADRVRRGATLYREDVCSAGIERAFEAAAPEIVFHLAAQTSVVRSVREPDLDARINIRGTLQVVRQSARHGVRRLVHSSTGGAIYGDAVRLPARETDATFPGSPYGVSKMASEAYVAALCPLDGVRYAALRYGNVYGPGQDPAGEAGVVAKFARTMLDRSQPVIFGDGSQERDYVYVDDVVEANVSAMESERDGVFNIGCGSGVSVRQVFDAVAAEAGYEGQPRREPARPGEVGRIFLDVRRAAEELDWRPQVPFEEGIRRTVESFRD